MVAITDRSTVAPRLGGSASRRPRRYTDCRDRSGESPSADDAGPMPCRGRSKRAAYADGSPWPSPPPGGSKCRPPPSDTKIPTPWGCRRCRRPTAHLGRRPKTPARGRKLPGPAATAGRGDLASATYVPHPEFTHQSGHTLAADGLSPRPVRPDPRRPSICSSGALVDLLDTRLEHGIGPGATRRRALQQGVVAAGGDLQRAAHRRPESGLGAIS